MPYATGTEPGVAAPIGSSPYKALISIVYQFLLEIYQHFLKGVETGLATVRTRKRENPFVQIDKSLFNNPDISWKAKGILGYLLSKPDDWITYVSDLEKRATDGRDSVRTGINELIDYGYIKRLGVRNDDGTFKGFEYIVHEIPVGISGDGLTEVGKSEIGKSDVGESNTTNNELTNKDITNNDLSNKRRKRVYDESSIHFILAKRLYDRILENNPDHKKPNLQKWADDVRLMMERDNRSEKQIAYVIDWCQKNDFWKSNILSISKLREKFDQLVIQIKSDRKKTRPIKKPNYEVGDPDERGDGKDSKKGGHVRLFK